MVPKNFLGASREIHVSPDMLRRFLPRGIAIACRPSVRLSVTLVDQDHIGWKSWKLIARTISLTSSLFVAQKPYLMLGEHGGIWGRLEVHGVEKVACWNRKSGNISETRKDRGKLTMKSL